MNPWVHGLLFWWQNTKRFELVSIPLTPFAGQTRGGLFTSRVDGGRFQQRLSQLHPSPFQFQPLNIASSGFYEDDDADLADELLTGFEQGAPRLREITGFGALV